MTKTELVFVQMKMIWKETLSLMTPFLNQRKRMGGE